MVKKSKKSKSKRITLRRKHKIVRKVKEHHRKKAKELRKAVVKHRSRLVKDPGIPNEWPFREQELKELEERRACAIVELELKKTACKARAKKRKLGFLEDADTSILVDKASSNYQKFEEQNIDVLLTRIAKRLT